MSEFFRNGGLGMYPVLLFGFLSVASAVLYLLRPERRFVSLMVALGITTATSGLLGFFTGLMGILRYVREVDPAERLGMIVQGVSASLHVIVLALTLLFITALVASIGAFRASRSAAFSPAAREPVSPHAL